MRILGIDPGLQTTGWGVIDAQGPQLAYVASGTIRSTGRGIEVATGDLPARIRLLFDGAREVMQAYRPDCAAALTSGDLPVSEYTALQMKKAVVGHGLAKKEQIQAMVQRLLTLPGLPGKDAADALGLAIMHAHASVSFSAMSAKTALQRRQHAQFKGGRTY